MHVQAVSGIKVARDGNNDGTILPLPGRYRKEMANTRHPEETYCGFDDVLCSMIIDL
jgi:hypothetical protein